MANTEITHALHMLAYAIRDLARSLEPTQRTRQCRQCSKPFPIGPDSGRRKDAAFCSDTCRVRFNSLKRKR
jgi:hypothetical protein